AKSAGVASGNIRTGFLTRFVLVPFLAACFVPAARAEQPRVEFNRQIRPLLSDRCFRCHGPDARQRQAELRLDIEAAAKARREGAPAIVPARRVDSDPSRRVVSEDEAERMPPPAAGKPLTRDDIDLLRRWIAEGAEYQPLWSFLPPNRPEIPGVRDTRWP